jgi:hypothetical protein
MAIAMKWQNTNANGKINYEGNKVYTYTPLLVTYNYFVPFRQTTKQ